MANSNSIAIIAIFKNEAPYILEWIAHHINIGVNFFYIADNESNDGTSELLAALDNLGIIKHIKFPTPKNLPPQLPAYEHLMREYGANHEWFAFIDADEFIMPQSNDSLQAWLDNRAQDPSVGGIALNWAVYGSSQKTTYSDDLVIKRFEQRGEKIITLNKHFKSIVRSSAFDSAAGNPHCFKIKGGFRYVHTDGKAVSNLVEAVDGLSKGVCWDHFRLNHYVVKSYEEFINKKNRGRATKPAVSVENRNHSFFIEHDVNDVYEAAIDDIVLATRHRIEQLKNDLIKSHGSEILESGRFVLNNLIHGHDDLVSNDGDRVIARGWAYSTDYKRVDLALSYDGENIAIDKTEYVDRPDVQKTYPDAPLNSGFVITANILGTLEGFDPEKFQITATVGDKSTVLKKN